MMDNLHTDDLLMILASVGTVALRRVKAPVSATPGHVPHRGWTCECDLPGYHHNGGGKPIMYGHGETPKAAAEACLAAIEEYIASDRAKAERERYLAWHALMLDRHRTEKPYGTERVFHPGRLVDEARINYGD